MPLRMPLSLSLCDLKLAAFYNPVPAGGSNLPQTRMACFLRRETTPNARRELLFIVITSLRIRKSWQALRAVLSLLRCPMWGCLAAARSMCHSPSAVAGRTCPRLPWRGQCANHRAPRPQRPHQQPTAWTHNTARRSPAALLTTNSTQEQDTHCYR